MGKTPYLLALFLLLSGCGGPSDTLHHRQILAFGTIIDISIDHPDSQLVDRAFNRLESDFQTMHRIWHPWEPGPLSRTNQLLQMGSWFSAAPTVLSLLVRSRQLSLQSRGYFNPAIGKLVRLWGFHRQDPTNSHSIDKNILKQLQSSIPNMGHIEVDGIRLRGHHPDIQIDFGGIGKGYGIDRAIDTLRTMRIENAIINAGGDLRAIGRHGNRPWKIGIQHPRKTAVLASIETLDDESVFTSGDYQRYYTQDGQRRQHIIDPFTGFPVTHTMAVTVIHENATVADVAATALMVAGPEHWYEIAQALGVKYVLLMARDGTLHMNPAMQKKIMLSGQDQLNIKISRPLK